MADLFPDAARRHRSDARDLAAHNRYQNAGHLIGFAAECLAKDLLQSAGINVDKASGFKKHFPELGSKIKIDGRTRVMAILAPIVSATTFLDGWTADGRYEANLATADAELRFNSWSADVESIFRAAGIP